MRQIKALIPSIVIGVVGNSVIYMIPLLVGGMVSDRGFSEQQSGFLASADLGGYAVSTFVTALLLDRFRWRHMAFAGLALMILANIATCQAHDLVPFALARIASGLGCGVLAALASVVVGQTEQPDRNYGVLLAASLLYGTAALWGLPVLLDKFGLNIAYWLLVGLAAVVMFVVPSLPNERAQRDAAAAAGGSSRWILAAAVLLSILLFWAEQNDVYAYAERIGNAAGIDGQFIGFSLGVANLTGFVGASLVAALGTRLGRLAPMVLSTVVTVICFVVLMGTVGPWTYLVAISTAALCWNIMNPFQLGILAGVDPTGRSLALAATVTGAGLALGPAIGALAIGAGGYPAVLWLACALAVVSLLLLFPPLRALRTS